MTFQPWPQNCCALGHHLFDHSYRWGRKYCRCGKQRGVGPNNIPASKCVNCLYTEKIKQERE